jgi:hypothetical protein
MPDITMCQGRHCKRRDKCYRHTAEPSKFMQVYFATAPVDTATGTCEYFWPVKGWEPEKQINEGEKDEAESGL